MALFIAALLCLCAAAGGTTPAVSQSGGQPEPWCHDWGESGSGLVRVLEGEAGWLSCPLFSHPTVYNYSSSQSAGLNLFWYRVPIGQDLEQPIEYSQRLSKERERLWLQPAMAEDTGQYICMLRNKTSCTKIAMRLEVLPGGASSRNSCEPLVAMAPSQVVIPFQGGKTLDCPDLQDVKMANSNHTVTWCHVRGCKCEPYPFWNRDREMEGDSLVVHLMIEPYQGHYYCMVSYERKGRTMNFTRMVNVTAVNPPNLPKEPSILNPAKDQVTTVKQATEVRLECMAIFPYLEGPWEMWWTIDGKTVDQLGDPRFSKTSRLVLYNYGDRKEEIVLVIQDFQAGDLLREYNCSVRNQRGFATRRIQLEEEVSLPSVELGCGLGVTLFLMLMMFVVYHVFWLELLLLYRSWFGTDERHTDDKEYDIYISYARNSEEEQFVLSTLRKVLENDLGYTVCIFDRDSLPGGTITDETLSFVGRSRRLLVVLSPGYGSQGTQALLELKAGLDGMARGGHLRVILVQYRPLRRQGWVRELRRARVALVLVRWQGDKSSELTSRFWKRLRVELPVRSVKDRSGQSEEGDVSLKSIQSHDDNINSNNALIPQHSTHINAQ